MPPGPRLVGPGIFGGKMTNSISVKQASGAEGLAVKMVVDAWKTQNTRVSEFLNKVSDEQLLKEISPGRNTGRYVLGHLTAVSDGLLPLFGLGERRFPLLEDHFVKDPEDRSADAPSPIELRRAWAEIIGVLQDNFENLTTEDWFQRHTAVSEEDFQKEPHRNRLNVLISRTNHQSYHLGQLLFLTNKGEN